MADDDKGAKPGTPSPIEHPAKPETENAPQSEWTASDRRGPLNAVGDEDVERMIPAHEMDAEGAVDHPVHDRDAAEIPAPLAGISNRDDFALHDAGAVGEAVAPSSTSTPHEPPPPSAAASIAAAPERRRSLVPVAAGLVVGALIGAGSAWAVYSQTGAGADSQQLAALSSRVDALDKRPDPQAEIVKLKSDFADLQGEVAALRKPASGLSDKAADAGRADAPARTASSEPSSSGSEAPSAKSADQTAASPPSSSTGSAPPAAAQGRAADAASAQPSGDTAPSTSDASLVGRVAALQAALDELKSRTGALQAQDAKDGGTADKVAALQTGVADAQKQAAGAQSALDALKDEQKQLGTKLAGLTVAVAGALKKAEGAEQQAVGAQTGVQTVQSQQKVLEGKLGSPALAVVTDSLVQQIDAGRPFARQVEALATLAADPAKIAVLRENASHGVPSAQALLAQWKPLADPVIATGNKAPANANFGQRLEHGLFGLVSVRRADGTTGSDLASRVALIEADLAHNDVPGAYAAWQALPADAKARSDSWGALAKTSAEALAAARDLQHAAIDALGAKKS